MLVKVHSHSLANGAGTIQLLAFAQSVSEEDPGLTFLEQLAPSVFVDNACLSPCYLTLHLDAVCPQSEPVTRCFGALARFVARGSRSGAGQISATISVELSAKVA